MLVHLVKKFLLGADFGLVVVGEGAGGLLLMVLGLGDFCCFLLMVVLLIRRLRIILTK